MNKQAVIDEPPNYRTRPIENSKRKKKSVYFYFHGNRSLGNGQNSLKVVKRTNFHHVDLRK